MSGFVNIGGILVPESSKPVGRFVCRLCRARFETADRLDRHIGTCVRRQEQEIHENSIRTRLSELYGGHDLEREAWLKTPTGRAWWERKMAEGEREF
jgi:hypothetical protein